MGDGFRLFCLETPTAIKFVIVTDAFTSNSDGKVESLLQSIYELYTDYVLKNPFYRVEQPIRIEAWETRLRALVEAANQ
eukprot:NODE_8966_length_388_cov_26.581121_g8075_i0.p1 GENE.NODE_8966_length_388_cov_26.581121_g8075_i0~~NODE_8966_length_388_cov_26.581121_g8075_i0.p1  ORF type:complete len:88 (-),score=27.85 NODE_8966_length_388_cov_26.581121_g8075_i0:123-359(-)